MQSVVTLIAHLGEIFDEKRKTNVFTDNRKNM